MTSARPVEKHFEPIRTNIWRDRERVFRAGDQAASLDGGLGTNREHLGCPPAETGVSGNTTGDRAVAVDPDPELRHPAIREWSGQLRNLADATGLSLRQLANHVPWSHSTLARYLNGERVVDEAWQLVPKLVMLSEERGVEVPAESRELRELYMRARQEYQRAQRMSKECGASKNGTSGTDASGNGAADSGASESVGTLENGAAQASPAPARRSRPSRQVLVFLAIVAALIGSFLIVWQATPREIKVWRTTIVGTWSDKYQAHLGVFRFRSPDISGDTDKATYYENTEVAIVCQDRHRRLVTDPTSGRSSTIWNKLSDGYWIPDLYTDLPKVDGEAPPLGIPLCR
jgi:hypothetical protein